MKSNAPEVATEAMKTGLSHKQSQLAPLSVFLWTPSTQQQPLPNPCCHGSQQVQTSSVVVIVESHTSERLSVNTDLFPQDWSCELRDDLTANGNAGRKRKKKRTPSAFPCEISNLPTCPDGCGPGKECPSQTTHSRKDWMRGDLKHMKWHHTITRHVTWFSSTQFNNTQHFKKWITNSLLVETQNELDKPDSLSERREKEKKNAARQSPAA